MQAWSSQSRQVRAGWVAVASQWRVPLITRAESAQGKVPQRGMTTCVYQRAVQVIFELSSQKWLAALSLVVNGVGMTEAERSQKPST